MRSLARQLWLCKKIPPICAECRFERRSNCLLNYRLNCRLNCAARKNSGKSSAAEFSHESCGVSKRTGSAEKRAGLIGFRAPARLRGAAKFKLRLCFLLNLRARIRGFLVFSPCLARGASAFWGSAFRRRAQAFCSAFGFFSDAPRARAFRPPRGFRLDVSPLARGTFLSARFLRLERARPFRRNSRKTFSLLESTCWIRDNPRNTERIGLSTRRFCQAPLWTG